MYIRDAQSLNQPFFSNLTYYSWNKGSFNQFIFANPVKRHFDPNLFARIEEKERKKIC